VCANMLAQRGILDLDAPVASVWPEFGAVGKGRIPIRWILSHQAGLPGVDTPLALIDFADGGRAVEALANQLPYWEPGTAHGYHALTVGTLIGEVVHRLTDKTFGDVFASEVAKPLGLEFWIGLPEVLESRVAPVRLGPFSNTLVVAAAAAAQRDPTSATSRVNLSGVNFSEFNERPIHQAELPAGNGIGSARSLARMYAACMGPVDGVRLFDETTLARACEVQASGVDLVLAEDNSFGLGFSLPSARIRFAGRSSFGHDGAGGAVAFGDRESGMSFAFTTDLFPPLGGVDLVTNELVTAAKECLLAR